MPVGLLDLLEDINGTRPEHFSQVSESQHWTHSHGYNQLGKDGSTMWWTYKMVSPWSEL
jgi:hypothetical protein